MEKYSTPIIQGEANDRYFYRTYDTEAAQKNAQRH
jgi:hypothetical protein